MSSPVLGITYPSFINDIDDNKASYYFSKDKHEEVIEGLNAIVSESDAEIKSKVYKAISDALGSDMIDAIDSLTDLMNEENITTEMICSAMDKKDIPIGKISEIENSIGDITCRASAVVDDKITIESPGIKASISQEKLIKRNIDGVDYLLIPISEMTKINGIDI